MLRPQPRAVQAAAGEVEMDIFCWWINDDGQWETNFWWPNGGDGTLAGVTADWLSYRSELVHGDASAWDVMLYYPRG